MNKGLFPKRVCKKCGDTFAPDYANQRMHHDCRRLWRRKYWRDYQRRQRSLDRQSLKELDR